MLPTGFVKVTRRGRVRIRKTVSPMQRQGWRPIAKCFRNRTRTFPGESDSVFERKEHNQHVILGNNLPDHRYHRSYSRLRWRCRHCSRDCEDSILRISGTIRYLPADGPPVTTGLTPSDRRRSATAGQGFHSEAPARRLLFIVLGRRAFQVSGPLQCVVYPVRHCRDIERFWKPGSAFYRESRLWHGRSK
jgi:hypothetical protein